MANPAIDLAALNAFFPEFPAEDTALGTRVDALNPVADLYVSTNAFGDAITYAKALVIAHLIKMVDNPNKTGVVTSTKVGDLSRSYATPADIKGTWGMTSYGIQLEGLKKARVMALGHVSPEGSSFVAS